MNLYGHPVLKFRTKDRLHISKEPGLLSWLTLLSALSLAILIDFCIIPDYFVVHAVFLILCLILSLNIMRTWDLIMDREENLVTVVNRSWYHGFSMRIPEENVKRFPITHILSVVDSSDSSIDINRRDGSTTKITSESNDRSLRKLRREISTFLCLERIEYLKGTDKIFYDWDMDPWNSSSGMSESQESDSETQENNLSQEESRFQYGSNIKIITGPL